MEQPPYPFTEEEYEMLVESFGALVIDEMIMEHQDAEKELQYNRV